MGGAEDEALEQWNELLAEEQMEAGWQGGKEDEDEDVDAEDHMVLKIMFIFWLVVCLFFFSHILGKIIPTDEIHHFSEGWLNHQPAIYGILYTTLVN